MKTIYIDVYFLLNFVVDVMALHLASVFSKIPIVGWRMFVCSIMLSLSACGNVLFDNAILKIVTFIIAVLLLLLAPGGTSSVWRRVKLVFASLLSMLLLGGGVYWLYDVLNGIVLDELVVGNVNRPMLIFACLIEHHNFRAISPRKRDREAETERTPRETALAS